MVPILILGATVLFAVFRRVVLPRRSSTRVTREPRLRPAPLALPALTALLAASGDVGLVAAREVRQRIGGRVFRVGTRADVAAAAAAIVVPVLERGAHAERVNVVGALSAPAVRPWCRRAQRRRHVHLVGVPNGRRRVPICALAGSTWPSSTAARFWLRNRSRPPTRRARPSLPARWPGPRVDEAVRAAGLSAAQVTALAEPGRSPCGASSRAASAPRPAAPPSPV